MERKIGFDSLKRIKKEVVRDKKDARGVLWVSMMSQIRAIKRNLVVQSDQCMLRSDTFPALAFSSSFSSLFFLFQHPANLAQTVKF